MEGAVDPELPEPGQARRRLLLPEEVEQLVAHPLSGHGCGGALRGGLAREPLGVRVHGEAEPRLVANGAEEPGGVVDEAPVVEHTDPPGLEVLLSAVGVVQLAEIVPGQPDRHRVHREVPPRQVVQQAGAVPDHRVAAHPVVRVGPVRGDLQP